MKRILCYGDSNTRGSLGSGRRMEDAKQWPNVLQQLLGDEYRVVQEGLSGRVAGGFERQKPVYNGRRSFEVAYRSAAPVDLVIVALGTNDLKADYGRSAQNIADDLRWYADAIQRFQDVAEGKDTKVLYICPENHPQSQPGVWTELIRIMQLFPEFVLDLGELQKGPDGLHYSEAAHAQVAHNLKEMITEIQV